MTINIQILEPDEFVKISSMECFAQTIHENVYIVRGLFDAKLTDSIRNRCGEIAKNSEASWHPCLDDCPDYHRIHHHYPNAYVDAIQHAFYFHPWNQNKDLFQTFLPIFNLKARLSNTGNAQNYLSNIPSTGPISRVLVHQYPLGGGGQEEHIDPVSPFAKIQTIIQASEPNSDFSVGGLYINHFKFGKIFLDTLTQKGDLIVLSPGVQHGVAPVDPESELNWQDSNGRWIIMPIIIDSDYKTAPHRKPKGLQQK